MTRVLLLVVALAVSGCGIRSVHDVVGVRPALERCAERGENPEPVRMLMPHLACR